MSVLTLIVDENRVHVDIDSLGDRVRVDIDSEVLLN